MPHVPAGDERQNEGVRFGRAVVVASVFVACADAPGLRPLDSTADGGGDAASVPPTPAPDAASVADAADAADAKRPNAPCGVECANAGGTCDGDVCAIACGTGTSCQRKKVKCPAGVACRVTCIDKDACETVTCGPASSCTVTCRGEEACKGDIETDATDTTVSCDGNKACNGTVICHGATCTITCADAVSCKSDAVRCCANQSCSVNGAPGSC